MLLSLFKSFKVTVLYTLLLPLCLIAVIILGIIDVLSKALNRLDHTNVNPVKNYKNIMKNKYGK